MHAKQLIDRFQFNHYAIFDQEIQTVRIFNQEVFIAYCAEFLFFKPQSPKSKLMGQGALIC